MAIAIWQWAVQNPVYAFGALLGLSLGIFYGFDGWRGSTADLDFQNSPRVKNLVWVLGAGFAAFIGDLKALDETAKKSLLLLYYFLPCILAAILVIAVWGGLVGVSRLWAARKGTDYGYGFSDAVGDYFFYGYRYYRERLDDVRRRRLARFNAEFCTQVAYAVAAIGSPRQQTLAAAQAVLQNIVAVVRSCRGDETDSLKIRSNLMLLRPCDDELRKRLIFAGDKAATVQRCLVSMVHNVDELRPGVVLPILPENLLFGAPTALVHPDGLDVIDDTNKIVLPAGTSDAVRKEVEEYFRTRFFKSFASIRVYGKGGEPIGAVNVDSAALCVFGRTDEEKKQVAQYLMPFLSVLGIMSSD